MVYKVGGILGSEVFTRQDKYMDWIDVELHILFEAYPNVINLLQ